MNELFLMACKKKDSAPGDGTLINSVLVEAYLSVAMLKGISDSNQQPPIEWR